MVECEDTLCYTASGGDYNMKSNSQIVKDHHSKLTEIKVRFPNAKESGYDYLTMIRERAEELGLINLKGKDKGKGSANAYILYLIGQDLGIEIQPLSKIEK